MFANEYTYMGSGVGVGDFKNDGLQDIFFAGYQVSSKLYINKSCTACKSGLILDGDVKDLKIITFNKQTILLAAINDTTMKAFVIKKKIKGVK